MKSYWIKHFSFYCILISCIFWMVQCGGDDNNTVGDDADNDSVSDNDDNCPNDANEDQKDTDNDGVGDVCDSLAVAKEVCDEKDNNGDGNIDEDEVVVFADPNLEAAIRDAIDKPSGDILNNDLCELTELFHAELNIVNLSGIEYCVALTELSFNESQITDISAISGLTKLTTLDLSDNQITDISAISGLINLTKLHISSNRISDISALSGLTNFTNLALYNNQISNISALSGLTNLTQLFLPNNQISDISALSGLTNLTYISLGYNQISDLKPLVDNIGLGEGNQVLLGDNPLDNEACTIEIPALRGRGVLVGQNTCN